MPLVLFFPQYAGRLPYQQSGIKEKRGGNVVDLGSACGHVLKPSVQGQPVPIVKAVLPQAGVCPELLILPVNISDPCFHALILFF